MYILVVGMRLYSVHPDGRYKALFCTSWWSVLGFILYILMVGIRLYSVHPGGRYKA